MMSRVSDLVGVIKYVICSCLLAAPFVLGGGLLTPSSSSSFYYKLYVHGACNGTEDCYYAECDESCFDYPNDPCVCDNQGGGASPTEAVSVRSDS